MTGNITNLVIKADSKHSLITNIFNYKQIIINPTNVAASPKSSNDSYLTLPKFIPNQLTPFATTEVCNRTKRP